MKNILIAFGIVMFTLFVLSFVFTSAKADEPNTKLECSAFVNEKICNMTEEEAEQWFWKILQAIIDSEKPEEQQPVDESDIHVNLKNIKNKELIKI